MIRFTKETYRFNNWLLFLVYVLISAVILFGYINYIVQDEMYYNSAGDRVSSERIREMLDARDKLTWISYVFIPVKLIIKISFTSICIYIGAALVDYPIRFNALFKISLLAEIVFIISAVIIFSLQLFFSNGETFEDLARFDVFSLHALLRSAHLPTYIGYPLQVINVFEIIYWLMLAAGLQFYLQKPFGRMLLFVLGTYGIGLLCWVIFIVFMTINYSA